MREISAMFFSGVSAVLLLSTLSVLKSWKEGRNVLEQVLIGIQTELWVTASSSEAEKERADFSSKKCIFYYSCTLGPLKNGMEWNR